MKMEHIHARVLVVPLLHQNCSCSFWASTMCAAFIPQHCIWASTARTVSLQNARYSITRNTTSSKIQLLSHVMKEESHGSSCLYTKNYDHVKNPQAMHFMDMCSNYLCSTTWKTVHHIEQGLSIIESVLNLIRNLRVTGRM